jgi:hypothetical protein
MTMLRGKTERETLELNGWGIGDILEGDEGYGPDRIKITGIGEERFLCRWDNKCKGVYAEESGFTTLNCRDWKKVFGPLETWLDICDNAECVTLPGDSKETVLLLTEEMRMKLGRALGVVT